MVDFKEKETLKLGGQNIRKLRKLINIISMFGTYEAKDYAFTPKLALSSTRVEFLLPVVQ